MWIYWSALLASAALSCFLTWLVRGLANRYGWAQVPRSRDVHKDLIPRLGGIAVFLAFLGVSTTYLFAGLRGLVPFPHVAILVKVVVPAIGVFFVGLIDDFRGITARTKLFAQIAGGCCLYATGLRFAGPYWPAGESWVHSAVWMLVTVLWVVLICNGMNLIDGLDGLAAGSALFSMVIIFTLAVVGSRPSLAAATVILAGALIGFLIFNFSPASIFLGDAGSLFVGFALSGFVLAASQSSQSMVDAALVPVISFALPLTDIGISFLRRFVSGHSVFGADQEHVHHKLLQLGLSHRQAVWILYGVSAAFTVLGLSLIYPGRVTILPVGAICLLLIFFGLRKLAYHELMEMGTLPERFFHQKTVLARNIAFRKAAAQLLQTRQPELIQEILMTALQQDFDGFEIALDSDFLSAANVRLPYGLPLAHHWNFECGDRMVLRFELQTEESGLLGEISLFRHASTRLLVHTDVLAGDFRRALARALLACLVPSPAPVPAKPVAAELPDKAAIA
jgi:UDP-GlcNAc:undecaprenyl-phosphate/decaprenyl-phosphate GlcNAc-1-phosphate transferase